VKQSNSPAVNSEGMFVVSGRVSTMYITEGKVNLLQGMRDKVGAAGLGAALQGMSGTVANAAMVAMYDGEDIQNFGFLIDDQLVIGTFEHVGFREGEEIKAVVTRLDKKALFAHAVVRPKDGLLWMPFAINKGRWEVAKWYAKLLGWVAFVGWLLVMTMQWTIPLGDKTLIEVALIAALGMVAYCGLLGFVGYRSGRDDAQYAENIMKVLGFKKPWRVNLSPFSEMRLRIAGSGQGSYQVYDLRKALRAYDSLSPTKQASVGQT